MNNDNNTNTGDIELIKHSPYFSETDFQRLQFGKGGLSIMSLNSQSINAKFDELRLFINRINKAKEIGVVCLQETWTSENKDIRLFQLPNYKLFDVEPLDLAFVCTKWEGHCVKISQTKPYIKQHVIGNIYKPPYEGLEDFNLFLTEFHDFVNMLSGYGHSSYICGDFNINLLKISTKSHYNTFFENMLSSGFYPKITLPTRICNTSSTIIDNIFSNKICSNDASGIFVNHISDHQAIFTITSTKLNNRMEQQYVSIETKDDASLNNFITEVRNMNISELLNRNINANPTENYALFSRLVQKAKTKHLPIKRIKFNKYKHKKCKWITNGILKSIKTKNIIYKMLKQTNPANVEAFETLKIRFNRFPYYGKV